MKAPYETLGVAPTGTDKESKEAFKKLAWKFHPDLHSGEVWLGADANARTQ